MSGLDDWLEANTVPYARGRVERGQLIKICPECGAEFVEETDSMGEQTTNNYADHYEKEYRA